MDFIFMLTRDDVTVPDAPRLLDGLAGLGLRHVGFKEVGADQRTLRALRERIAAMGAASYLETVSPGTDECIAAARTAVEIGVDHLLGGTAVDEALDILKGTGIGYHPFPGFPEGHPTRLRGSAAEIAGHCATFMAKGCAGADLLAYRATDADPLDLIIAARGALGSGVLIVAGGIDGPAQIGQLKRAGVDAFTIGTAIFDKSFAAGALGIADQIRAVQDALAADSEPAPATP